jgi:hypothetical protein
VAMSDLARDIDRDTVVQSAAAGVLIVGPLAGLSVLLVDTESESSGGLGGVFFLAILVGFGLVGGLAARAAPRVPLTHGAVAALVAFVVVQVTVLLIAFVSGHDSDVNPFALVFGALMAASAGTIGALIGTRRRRGRVR